MAAKDKYIFRGTTIGFKGGKNCHEHSYTCTSTHPVIALLFAMECANQYSAEAVVYVANIEKVRHLKKEPNVLKKVEKEYVVGVSPTEFIKYTEGYISCKELKEIIEQFGFDVSETVRKEKLTELCKGVRAINSKEIDILIDLIKKVIKKS